MTAIVALAAAVLMAAPSAARAQAPRGAWTVLAQADTTSNPSGPQANPDEGEEDDNGVPIPPNLLEPEPKAAPPDTSGAGAARSDSTRNLVPANPAQPETLRYHQPGTDTAASAKKAPPIVTAPTHRGGILGVTPVVVLLGLAVIHFLVVSAVK